ncbi:MAG: hypothetical protein ACYTBJ_22435 [Planctomycetota bacterium]
MTSWTGQQGYSDATSGAGTRPTVATAGAFQVVRYNGTDQFLTLSASGIDASAYHCFIVANTTTPAALRAWWSNRHLAAPSGGTVTLWGMSAAGGASVFQNQATDTSLNSSSGKGGVLHLCELSASSGARSLKWDDVAAASDAPAGNNTLLAAGYIGRDATVYIGMDLYEMIWFPAVLSGADRTALLGYINTRYSLSAT